jgi:hypothetical protein
LRAQSERHLAIATLLVCTAAACAQLPAPTAISDAEYSACGRHTCVWVPYGLDKTFTHGEFSYTVKTAGNIDLSSTFVLRRDGKVMLETPLEELSASTSVVWSDDNRHFAVTWSNGGAAGWFNVKVFRIDGDSVTELPAVAKAYRAFKDRHWREARGDNVQAYNWLSDSRRLVLVLSVYPTSDCGKEMGHTEGYVVDAETGAIKEHWNLAKLNAYLRSHSEWPAPKAR